MSDESTTPAPKKRKPVARKRKPATKPDSAVAESGQTRSPTPVVDATVGTVDIAQTPTELISVPLSVRWRDLDAFNHVNNSKYLSYLEEARLRWMMSMPGMGLEDDVAPVVAASTLNYRRPIEWPNEVVVQLFVERLGNTSVTIGHRITAADDADTVYCDGHVVMVWIDRSTGRASALPESVRTACAPG